MISNEDRDRVREATDIVSLVQETVILKQRGSDDFWGCCPFHQEKSPSFHVRAAAGLWHCFGCGEGGDVFEYVKKRENLDFPEAIRYLAARAGIELHETSSVHRGPQRSRLEECLSAAQTYYQSVLLRSKDHQAEAARKYLSGRGFGLEVCKRWGIGFAPATSTLVQDLTQRGFKPQELEAADLALNRSGRMRERFFNRVMFPITNERGITIGFGGRVLGDEKPKYLNSKDSSIWHKSKNLFAFDKAKDAILAAEEVIIVEGYTDCISLHEAGLTHSVAVLGTALTGDHIKMLSRLRAKRIISLFDGDEAGQRAAAKVARFVDKTPAHLLVCLLPENLDPAEYLEKNGVDSLRQELQRALPVMDFIMDKEFKDASDWTPGTRIVKLKEVAEIFAPLMNSPVLATYITRIADFLNISNDEVMKEIHMAAARQAKGEAYRRQQNIPGTNDLSTAPSPQSAPGPQSTSRSQSAPNSQSALSSQSAPSPQAAPTLTQEEALRLKMERELLSLLAENRGRFSEDFHEVDGVAWLDASDEAIFRSLKQTKPSDETAAIMSRIMSDCVDAPRILAAAESELDSQEKAFKEARFLINNILFLQKQESLRRIKSSLNNDTLRESEKGQELLRKATSLQRDLAELQNDIVGRAT